jgi:hypothetical protein
MPSVSLALLSLGMALPAAVQIMVVPTVVTNVWQALVGDGFGRLVWRFRMLLLATVAGVWIGYVMLFRHHPKLMTAVLGAAIALYALSGLAGIPLMPKVRRERLASPLVGLSTGVLAGATGNISMPMVIDAFSAEIVIGNVVQHQILNILLYSKSFVCSLHSTKLKMGPNPSIVENLKFKK